jgi:hypothetical protein
MAPGLDNSIAEALARFDDHHMSAPSAVDAQHPGAMSRFGCICGLTNQGKTLVTLLKIVGADGSFRGLMNSSKLLPEGFHALWCRIFYRHERALVLVMDVNRQDFIIYDVETSHSEGQWTLHEPLPEGARLSSVETLIDELMFSVHYTADDNEYAIDCRFEDVPE